MNRKKVSSTAVALALVARSALVQGQPAPPPDSTGLAVAASPSSPADEPEAQSAPAPNDSEADAPSEAMLSDAQSAEADDSGDSGHVDKGDSPYIDVNSAWGWRDNSWLVTISPFNFYLHEEDSVLGLHGRVLGLGALSYRRSTFEDGLDTGKTRKTHPFLDVVSLQLRWYVTNAFYVSLPGVTLGGTFYDGFVPTADLQGGLGLNLGGWGLESGVRLTRWPHAATTINGDEFISVKYGFQAYLTLETNLVLFGGD